MERFELQDEEGPLPARQAPGARGADRGSGGQGGHPLPHAQGGPWRWSEVNAHPVTDADGTVIQAINVFRDVTAERDADERRRFLLRAVDELSSSLDYEATLAAVARLAVPTLADWCAVDIVDGDQLNGSPRRTSIRTRSRPSPSCPGATSQSGLEDRRARDHSHAASRS